MSKGVNLHLYTLHLYTYLYTFTAETRSTSIITMMTMTQMTLSVRARTVTMMNTTTTTMMMMMMMAVISIMNMSITTKQTVTMADQMKSINITMIIKHFLINTSLNKNPLWTKDSMLRFNIYSKIFLHDNAMFPLFRNVVAILAYSAFPGLTCLKCQQLT